MLLRFPLCVMCKAEGIYRPTDEIDHVVPLSRGGSDTEDNLQGLCEPHHTAKSLAEGGYNHARVSNHPEWLEPSRIPLTIVCGPPCSGKSTLARRSATASDLIVDLDDILLELDPSYRPWTGNRDHLNEAIRLRNRMLGSLAHRPSFTRAWFVISAPTAEERAWWQGKLGGELVLLHPGIAECKRRAIARGTPGALSGIDDWERRSRLPWSRPKAKLGVDADGWPNS